MGGINWYWEESIDYSSSDDFYEYEILVRANDQETYIYAINGFLEDE